MEISYGLTKTTTLSPGEAEAAIRESLGAAGFGILTEIDVAATLQDKLGIDRAPYKILGACNPSLANQALGVEESIGLLLPCNVAVYESSGTTVVAALDPNTMVDLTDNAELAVVAAQARELLAEAVSAVPD